jgi:hypothetical protein
MQYPNASLDPIPLLITWKQNKIRGEREMLNKVALNHKTVELTLFSSKGLLKHTWNLNFQNTNINSAFLLIT